MTVPMNQFFGPNHGWSMLTRITPVGKDDKPVYLLSSATLPNVPKTKAELQFGGGYLLGEGAYDVRWMMLDDVGRVCRKNWHVEVRRSHAEQKVRVAMPPDYGVGTRPARRPAAAAFHRRCRAPAHDHLPAHRAPLPAAKPPAARRHDDPDEHRVVAIGAGPARSVRLVLFNLDQQRELYRKEGFLLRNMAEVSQAMINIELGMVDFQVLQNKRGHVDLLADLVNREMATQPPSDVVVFLGPMARHFERMPQESLEKPAGHGPQFYYFQLSPFLRTQPMPGDTIKSAVARMGGKTILIHTPGEFAKAIERLEKAGKRAGVSGRAGLTRAPLDTGGEVCRSLYFASGRRCADAACRAGSP